MVVTYSLIIPLGPLGNIIDFQTFEHFVGDFNARECIVAYLNILHKMNKMIRFQHAHKFKRKRRCFLQMKF